MKHIKIFEEFKNKDLSIDPFASYEVFTTFMGMLRKSPLYKPKHEIVFDEIESYYLSGKEDGEDEDFDYYVDLTGDQIHDGANQEGEVEKGRELDDEDFDDFQSNIRLISDISNKKPKEVCDLVSKIVKESPEMIPVLSKILATLPEDELDSWFTKNPLEIDLLDEYPEVKAGVLKRTRLRDISRLASIKRRGMI